MQKFLLQRVLTVTFLTKSATFIEKKYLYCKVHNFGADCYFNSKPLIYFSALISPKNFYFFKTNDSKLHVTKSFLSTVAQLTTVKRQPRAKRFQIRHVFERKNENTLIYQHVNINPLFPGDFSAPTYLHIQAQYAHVVMALKCWQIASG